MSYSAQFLEEAKKGVSEGIRRIPSSLLSKEKGLTMTPTSSRAVNPNLFTPNREAMRNLKEINRKFAKEIVEGVKKRLTFNNSPTAVATPAPVPRLRTLPTPPSIQKLRLMPMHLQTPSPGAASAAPSEKPTEPEMRGGLAKAKGLARTKRQTKKKRASRRKYGATFRRAKVLRGYVF